MMQTGIQREQPVVLIVDDDMTVRLLARESLEQAGLSVEEAEDGTQALSTFERLQPDLVLLDVYMPGMDGFRVCEALRKLPGGEATPVLMVTGADDIDSINCAYEVGATDFAIKPVNWLILQHRVRSCCVHVKQLTNFGKVRPGLPAHSTLLIWVIGIGM